MSVNITLQKKFPMGPEVYHNIGGEGGKHFHNCQFKGSIIGLTKADNKQPSRNLEGKLSEILQSVSLANRQITVIFFYTYITPHIFYNGTTRIIVCGEFLQKVISAYPEISITLSATLIIKNDTTGVELLSIPIKHKLVPSYKVNYYQSGDLTHLKICTGTNYLITKDEPGYRCIFNIYQARNNIRLVDFTVTFTLSQKEQATEFIKENLMLNPAFTKGILGKKEHTDLIIVARDGTEFNCHKCFLTAQSDVFKEMLSCEGLHVSMTSRIEIDDMSNEGIQALLEFIYAFDIEPAKENAAIALELLQAGHKYKILDLKDSIKRLILTYPGKMLEVDSKIEVCLGLFAFVRNIEVLEQLRNRAFKVLGKRSKELMSCEYYKNLFNTDTSAAMELCALALGQLNQ